jgi:hypothetical protein
MSVWNITKGEFILSKLSTFLNRQSSSYEPEIHSFSHEDIESLIQSPSTQINNHLDELFGDLSENTERQIKAIEDIANHAERQATASETLAKLASEQAEKAMNKSLLATLKANKAFYVSIMAVLVTFLANLDKIVLNIQKVLSYLGLQ